MRNARFSDLSVGVCSCHPVPPVGETAMVVTSSTDTFNNGLGQARHVDLCISSCGHPGVFVTYSPDTYVNSRGRTRVTDVICGCISNVQIQGSPDTFVNK